MWMTIIVFGVVGTIGIISPKTSWQVSNWWRFNGEAKPSSASLFCYRIGGILFLIVSFLLIFNELLL